jgi:hypothetical protein
MFKNINIGIKITLMVFAMVAFSFAAASYISYTISKRAILQKYNDNINQIADLKAYQIDSYFEDVIKNATRIRQSNGIKEAYINFYKIENAQNDSVYVNTDSLKDVAIDRIAVEAGYIFSISDISNLIFTDQSLNIIYTGRASDKLTIGSKITGPNQSEFEYSRQETVMGPEFFEGEKLFKYIISPLEDQNGQFGGLAVFKMDLSPVIALAMEAREISGSSEMVLGKKEYNRIVFLNELRFDTARALSKSVVIGDNKAQPIQFAIKGESGSFEDLDYRGKKALSVWRYLPAAQWGMVIKVDSEEIYNEANSMINNFLIVGVILILLATLVSLIFSRFLISPLLSLKETLNLLSKGILPEDISINSGDEIGQMATTTNNLVTALRDNATFAQYIGQGKYDVEFEPQSEEDTLGNALINMRDSIQESEKQDQERNWIVTGQAEIGDLLRLHDTIDELGDAVISYVTNKIHAIQGAFYVLNDDSEDDIFLELKASYAYNKKKYLKGRFKFAEGLVGQAAIEQDTVLRTEIPNDYVTITSGLLGEQRPSCILIVPLITDERVYGALEFAGYQRFSPMEVKFVEEVSLIIARTIFNIKVNERTRKLLAESQQMSNELQEKQEVLRQNAEEMEATQEELKRINIFLE